jgi:predicted DsbA family dithiol-disulfide isomerase
MITNSYLSDYQFEQLKECFDKNDCYSGARMLSELLNNWAATMAMDIETGNVAPADMNTSQAEHLIELDERLEQMSQQITMICEQVGRLQAMHVDGAEHVPTIVTTSAQLEALAAKEESKSSDRVVVETSFERARRALG